MRRRTFLLLTAMTDEERALYRDGWEAAQRLARDFRGGEVPR